MKSYSISLLVRNDLLREGLGRLLAENDFVISQSIDDTTALDVKFDSENHIIILDCSPGQKHPLDETTDIINAFSRSQSVVLADEFDCVGMQKCFSAGANGYILNDVSYKTFVAMINLVAIGEYVVPSQFIEMMKKADIRSGEPVSSSISPDEFDLSDRDVKILDRLSLGLSNKMISRELGISEATVKVAVKTIYRKLSVNNRTQAAILAREINLLPKHRNADAPKLSARTVHTSDIAPRQPSRRSPRPIWNTVQP